MKAREEAELLIDLTEIHAQHDASISKHTVFLSVIISLMFAIVTVYIPLTLFFNNIYYSMYAIAFDIVLLVPLLWVAGRIRNAERRLEERITDLRNGANSVSFDKKKRSNRQSEQPKQPPEPDPAVIETLRRDSPDPVASEPEPPELERSYLEDDGLIY